MPLTYPVLPTDQITYRDALPAMEAVAAAKGRYLMWWPLNETNPRLVVVRSYTTAARYDEAKSLAYLGLEVPPSDP